MVGAKTQLRPAQLLRVLKLLIVALAFIALGVILARTLVSPEWKLAITYSGIGFYITALLVNPLLGFLLWIATAPFARFWYLNISLGASIPDLSLDRLAAALAFILVMAPLAIRRRNLARFDIVDLFMLLFVIGTGISLPFAMAGPRATAQAYFDTQIVPLLIYFLAKNLITNKGTARIAVAVLLLIGAYMAFLVIHEQLTGVILFYPEGRTVAYTAHLRRAVGLLGNPAFFAIILGMILPFSLRAFLRARQRWQQLFLALLNGGIVAALYFCYNRAGWLAALASVAFMCVFYAELRKRLLPLLLVAGLVVGVFWGQISESYVITERLSAEGPINYRLNAVNIAMRMVSSNPIFGRGYGNFGYLYEKYATDLTETHVLPAPHNTYMNILVSSGLAGLLPYIGIFVGIAYQGWVLWKRGQHNHAIDRTLLVCVVAALVVYASTIFFSDIVAIPYVTGLFFFITGLVLGAQERANRWGDPEAWLA